MNFLCVDYADCSQSTVIYGKICLNKFSMSHVYRKTRVLSEIIKSWPEWAKMDEKLAKKTKFVNFMRIDYADCAQSTGIYIDKCQNKW